MEWVNTVCNAQIDERKEKQRRRRLNVVKTETFKLDLFLYCKSIVSFVSFYPFSCVFIVWIF